MSGFREAGKYSWCSRQLCAQLEIRGVFTKEERENGYLELHRVPKTSAKNTIQYKGNLYLGKEYAYSVIMPGEVVWKS